MTKSTNNSQDEKEISRQDPSKITENLDRTHRELNVLYEVSTAMRTTLDLDHILYIILTGVTSHSGLGYNRALLFLENPKLNTLQCKMAIGPESGEHADKIWKYIENSNQDLDDLIQSDKISRVINESSLYKKLNKLHLPLNQDSLLKRAFDRGTPWHLPPSEIPNYASDPLLQYFSSHELVIVPLRAKDLVNGLIVADNIYTQKPIKEVDIRIFTMLANQAGLAVENSQLYEMVVQKSRTDSITSLWNHGFFQERLSEEVKKAQRTHAPLSLAMIDLDDFKKLNDTFGHQQGDLILKELADVLRNFSRDTDWVCRYGGEEFTIILPQTPKQRSYDIAERLRSVIEHHTFFIQKPPLNHQSSEGQLDKIQLTVSIGLATFPDDAQEKEELIGQADKAMYIAKFSGKNKACLSTPDQDTDIRPQ